MEDWVNYFVRDDGSYEYYINEKRVDKDTQGVAPFILAAIELDR